MFLICLARFRSDQFAGSFACSFRVLTSRSGALASSNGFKVNLLHLLAELVRHVMDLMSGLFEFLDLIGDKPPLFIQLGH